MRAYFHGGPFHGKTREVDSFAPFLAPVPLTATSAWKGGELKPNELLTFDVVEYRVVISNGKPLRLPEGVAFATKDADLRGLRGLVTLRDLPTH